MNNLNFENLTIHELRVLARELKIKSPTSKRRKELIYLINLAQVNQLPDSETNNSKKGRPYKSRLAINVVDSRPLFIGFLNEIHNIQNKLKKLEKEIRKNVE